MRGVMGEREKESKGERGEMTEQWKERRPRSGALNHWQLQATNVEQELSCLVLFGMKEE